MRLMKESWNRWLFAGRAHRFVRGERQIASHPIANCQLLMVSKQEKPNFRWPKLEIFLEVVVRQIRCGNRSYG